MSKRNNIYWTRDKAQLRQLLIVSGILFCVVVPYSELQLTIAFDLHRHITESAMETGRWLLKILLLSSVLATFYLWFLMIIRKSSFTIIFIVLLNVFMISGQLVISLYYDYFSELPHLRLIYRLSEASQISHQIFLQLFGVQEWIIVLNGIANVWLSLALVNNEFHFKSQLKILSFAVLLSYCGYQYINFNRKDIRRQYDFGFAYVSSSYGFIYAYTFMLEELIQGLQQHEVPFPGKINPLKHTGLTHPFDINQQPESNVIMIQVESLGTEAIFHEENGKKIMPFLNNLANKSIFFDNFYAQHSGGGSSDAELSTLLSLLPLRSHSGLRTANYSKTFSLLQVLKQYGYTTIAMHANKRQFFNRAYAYQGLGFDRFYSERDYQGKARGIYSHDNEFYRQSLDKINALPEPYLAYLITVQSHGPFQVYTKETKAKFDFPPEYSNLQKDYLYSIHEVDQALQYFITELQQFKKLDHTIVMIFADEYPQILAEKRQEYENIPLFILAPGLSSRVEHKLGSHLDIASTLSALLKIPEAENWLGSSLLTADEDRLVLYNNLTTITRRNATLHMEKNHQHKIYMEYSQSILE